MSRETAPSPLYQTYDSLLGAPMDISCFLNNAIAATAALARLHEDGLIHKQLCPNCFIIHPEDQHVSILHDAMKISDSQGQMTLLVYMSPEQSGRMQRSVDARSDLYSLGIILYQMLTGEIPFVAADALEWVHCHIARIPNPPIKRHPELPLQLSDLLMKILEKNPEARYQSAAGLQRDLEQCRNQYEKFGLIQNFSLGVGDISRQLLIPQKLYGREHELSILRNLLDRITTIGTCELVMISGYSGIGKTSLVRELHESIIKAGCLNISGKFDQYANAPYSIFGEAFRELIRQILTKKEERLAEWRSTILDAVGINGKLMTDIIPQLELIIGKQPPVVELAPSETENRFTTVFKKFVAVFAQRAHPLVLFVYDLQWSDLASLKLIRTLVSDPDTHHLLLIGSYRDNEVSLSHPLILMLEAIAKERDNLHCITLSHLSQYELRHFIADTVTPNAGELDLLSGLIHEKTDGNPFFVCRFLTALFEEKLLYFDVTDMLWKWDIESITAKDYSDNVVDLIMNTLRKRPEQTQEILKLAACIGNRFDKETLQSISPETEYLSALEDAVMERLVLSKGDGWFTFLHDRVQQAAYQLIPEPERAELHLKIAQLMLRRALNGSVEEKTFEIINQYNNAISLIVEKDEKLTVIGLNLIAAKKAKFSTAYSSALDYLTLATSLLEEGDWDAHYDLAYNLYKEKGELEYLNSQYELSEDTIYFLAARAVTNLEKAQLYNTLIVQYTLLARYADAIATGREALKLLNVILPDSNLQNVLQTELSCYASFLNGRTIKALADEPEMTDETALVCLELLSNLVVPARYSDKELFHVILLLNVNWSLQYGPTAKTTVGYSCFGMFLNDALNRFDEAYQFGLVALALSERFHATTQKCQSSFVLGHYLVHWVRHLREVDSFVDEGMQAGLASGEMQWTGYTMAYRLFPPYYRGEQIRNVLRELPNLLHFTQKTHNQWAHDTLIGFRLALAELSEPGRQSGLYDEAEYVKACKEHKSYGALGRFYVLKLQILYLFGDLEGAEQTIQLATNLAVFFSSSISVPAFCLYAHLTCAALYLSASNEEKLLLRIKIQQHEERMSLWTESCPQNFQHQLFLMQAESAHIEGESLKAIGLFESSIGAAAKNGFLQDQALACERVALLCLDIGFQTSAQSYMKQAYILYRRWGADKKVRQLEATFATLLSGYAEEQNGLENQIGHLDTISIIRASQAISSEIVLSRLLETLLWIVMENAGAQKGYILLLHEDVLAPVIGASVIGTEIELCQDYERLQRQQFPQMLCNYVQRTVERLVIDDATEDELALTDPYMAHNAPLSLLFIPLLHQGKLIGELYLENHILRGAFTVDRLEVLELLASQAAISIENAELYEERKHTEEVLRGSEEKYRQLFDHCGTALVFIEEDATISMCNKEFELLSGYSCLEIEGKLKWSGMVLYDDELIQMQEYHRLRRISPLLAPQEYEFHLKDKNGNSKDVVATVTTIPDTQQSMAVLADITERKKNEADRIRLVAALEQSAEAIFITNERWRIIYANQACLQVTGYTRDELIGNHVNIVKPELHDKIVFLKIKKILDTGDAWTGRITLKKKDGALYEAEATNAPVKDKDGLIVSYICTHRDISKELQLEQDLRQAQKMEAIGTLAGGIAHDFNNLLTAILGSAELATAKIDSESSAMRDLRRIAAAGNRAKELVAQILTYSRQREHEKKPVHIAIVIDEVLKLLRASIPTTIQINQHIDIKPDADIIMADSTQLHQVLMNLGTNAAHAMRESGGTLNVSLSIIDTDAAMRMLYPDLPHGSCSRITVSDTGHGMDNIVKARIFDPYFTTKTFGEGTGMGLSVVEGIVKSHGGAIHVYSEVGKGTTFHIFLPRIEPSMSNESFEQPEVSRGGTERILFVDDEEILAEMGKELFETLGYHVTATTSSQEALRLFKGNPDSFDIIITDMTMPIVTGKDLAEQAIALRPDIPIILCTGFSDCIDEQMAQKIGIKAYVMKPYSVNTLDLLVRKILEQEIISLE